MITIRKAEESDVAELKILTDRMLAHTGLGVATVEKICALVTSPKTLFLLAVKDDELIGFACGYLHRAMFNDRAVATDVGIYVNPEYRGTTLSKKFIGHLEQWAKAHGAEELWLGQTTGDDPERVIKYYGHLGYKTKGFNCVKEL
jgi:GNAT superfamily N-acetyltransferase